MKRYAMKIAYDGSQFYGWQIQPLSPTVQERLQDTLTHIAKIPITLIGAGRTDTGVHAIGQVAHFDFPVNMTTQQLLLAINSKVSPSIKITDIAQVDPDFHSRYHAIARTYRYIITTAPDPFNHQYKSAFPRYHIHLDRLIACIPYFMGKHDFTSFAKPNPQTKNYVCDIADMHLECADTDIILTITADRFLHNMIRRIVGAMVTISHKDLPPEIITKWLADKKHNQKNYFTATPNGLYLYKIQYPMEIFC